MASPIQTVLKTFPHYFYKLFSFLLNLTLFLPNSSSFTPKLLSHYNPQLPTPMSNLIHLNDYREKRQQLELVRFIPLAEGVPAGKVLVPIENAGGNLGLLVASYYEACAGCGNHVAEHALYVRQGENQGEKYSSTEFDRVYFTRKGQLYTAETEQAIVPPHHSSHYSETPERPILPPPTILPLPSQYPYVACELTAVEYLSLKEKFLDHRRRYRQQGLAQAVDILTERADFAQRQTGQWWWKQKQLITPKGYADQI